MKTVGEIERIRRSGWYFVKEPTFHIPCLLAVGRYSEADSELCVALEKVAGFEDVPKTIRDAVGEDGVDPGNCVGTHTTVDGPYGPVQYINMRDFDWCPHCIEALAHEITHAVRGRPHRPQRLHGAPGQSMRGVLVRVLLVVPRVPRAAREGERMDPSS